MTAKQVISRLRLDENGCEIYEIWKPWEQRVQNCCFLLLNMQICDILVAVRRRDRLKLAAPCSGATNQTWTLTIKNAANILLLEPEQNRCCKKFRLYSILHHETWIIVVKCPTFHAWFLHDRPPCKRSGGTIMSSQHRGRVYEYRLTESISISWVELTSFLAIEAIK